MLQLRKSISEVKTTLYAGNFRSLHRDIGIGQPSYTIPIKDISMFNCLNG